MKMTKKEEGNNKQKKCKSTEAFTTWLCETFEVQSNEEEVT